MLLYEKYVVPIDFLPIKEVFVNDLLNPNRLLLENID